MDPDILPDELKSAVGKRVEALAFGIAYIGRLKGVDLNTGVIKIEDGGDYAVLEIERIESFRILPQ